MTGAWLRDGVRPGQRAPPLRHPARPRRRAALRHCEQAPLTHTRESGGTAP
jgi:hypothetical protein